jgi:gamma-polyglutamate synthase
MGALVEQLDPARVILIGEPTRSAAVAVAPQCRDRIVDLGGRRDPAELLRSILSSPHEAISLAAIGNIHGQGEVLLEQLDRLARTPADGTRS